MRGEGGGFASSMINMMALCSLLTATVLQALDLTIATIALPAIGRTFGLEGEAGSWILTSYIVAMALMTPVGGVLSSAFGRRNALLLAIGGLTLASLACGVSGSFAFLLAARLAQGASAGIIVPLVQATLLDMTPKAEHGRAMSLFGAAIMVGPVLGPSIGGVLVDTFGWRSVFFINLPIGLFAFVGALLTLGKLPSQPAASIDPAGLAIFGTGIVALQLMLDRGNQAGWFASPEILLVAGGLGGSLVRAARRTDAFPSIAPFKDRNFAVTTCCVFLAGFIVAGSIFLVPSLLQSVFGHSATAAGLAMAPRGVGTMATMLAMSRTVGRVDHRSLLLIGIVLNAFAIVGLALVGFASSILYIAGLSLLQGVGVGLIFTPLSTAAFSFLPEEQRGDATGIYSLMRHIGSGVGVSILTGFLFHHVGEQLLLRAYRSGFYFLLAVVAVMGLAILLIRTDRSGLPAKGISSDLDPSGQPSDSPG
jgi:MFS transporter, DHA2 family, multidrug resistance protein